MALPSKVKKNLPLTPEKVGRERRQEMLDDIERRAFDNPWLQSTVQMLKVLLSNRDHGRMEKELMYASYSMKSRLSEIDEMSFNSNSEEVSKAAFLRRKSYQGRRSAP